jgi:hypothetical protein
MDRPMLRKTSRANSPFGIGRSHNLSKCECPVGWFWQVQNDAEKSANRVGSKF